MPSRQPGSECCVSRRRRRPRSVHSGCVGCVIEPRNGYVAGAETVQSVERNMDRAAKRGHARLPGSKSRSRAKGSRRNLGDPAFGQAIPLLVRIGKGKPIADDERTREVGPSSSSCEAGEQGGAIRRGAGGAKGWDQGECKPATLGPDAEPGNRVTGAGAHTSNRKGKEEGTVHSALSPYQRRTAPGCVLRHQAGGSPRRRRGDMAGLRGKCGDKSP